MVAILMATSSVLYHIVLGMALRLSVMPNALQVQMNLDVIFVEIAGVVELVLRYCAAPKEKTWGTISM